MKSLTEISIDEAREMVAVGLPMVIAVDSKSFKPSSEAMATTFRFGYVDSRATAYVLGKEDQVFTNKERGSLLRPIQYYTKP